MASLIARRDDATLTTILVRLLGAVEGLAEIAKNPAMDAGDRRDTAEAARADAVACLDLLRQATREEDRERQLSGEL